MLMQADTRAQVVARTLRTGWWTVLEISALAEISPSYTWKLMKRQAQGEIVFRRNRPRQKNQPFEYRCFDRAVNVRGEPSA